MKPTLNQLKAWKRASKKIKGEIKKIQRKTLFLNKKLSLLEIKNLYVNQVSYFHKGIPIDSYNDEDVRLIIPINGKMRRACIYQNANNKSCYGIRVKEWNENDGAYSSNEIWLGAGYPSLKAVKNIALNFLVDGSLPLEDKRKY